MERRGKSGFAVSIATLLAGLGIGACVARGGVSQETQKALGLMGSPAEAAGTYDAAGEPIVQAVKKAAPAVVSIDTTSRRTFRVRDPYDDFGTRRIDREVPSGAGSGMLLDSGYVLTNQHVVGDAVETRGSIQISLPDGRKFPASVVGVDRQTDVALLKIAGAKNLPSVPLGRSDILTPGQTVIAIGNPVGLSASVSSGIVSALGRPLSMPDRTYENLIQTDTAINPGNSGGALIDLGGNVVGINTLVRSDAQNIGFAIPIKTALRVVEELKRYGKIRRPSLGVVVADLEKFNHSDDVPKGVVVYQIYRGSPAAEAGIRRLDLIVSVGGKAVASESDFRQALESAKIGQTVRVGVWRIGEITEMSLPLIEAP